MPRETRDVFICFLFIMNLRLISCKEKLDGWKYGLAPENKDVPTEQWDYRFTTALIWSDYIDYLIDLIDFGENDDRYELFINRKEVEEIAERLTADSGPDGNDRARNAS